MLNVRCHDGPGPGVFLRQHKRHQVDLSESAWAHHTVVSHTSILHVVGSDTQISTKSVATPVRPYTKCLMVAPMPPFCTPLMYAVQMVPERCGSSEKLSKLCRKRGMHKRRSCGAAVLCSHDLRVDSERQSRRRDKLMMHDSTHTLDIASGG